MDKKSHPQRRKALSEDELNEIAPRGASFDTEEGRAAQGKRDDIGKGPSEQEKARDEPPSNRPAEKSS